MRDRGEQDVSASHDLCLDAETPYIHAANSAALLRDRRVWYDRVRPGLLSTGSCRRRSPHAATDTDHGLGSRIVAVKGVRAGKASATA